MAVLTGMHTATPPSTAAGTVTCTGTVCSNTVSGSTVLTYASDTSTVADACIEDVTVHTEPANTMVTDACLGNDTDKGVMLIGCGLSDNGSSRGAYFAFAINAQDGTVQHPDA